MHSARPPFSGGVDLLEAVLHALHPHSVAIDHAGYALARATDRCGLREDRCRKKENKEQEKDAHTRLCHRGRRDASGLVRAVIAS